MSIGVNVGRSRQRNAVQRPEKPDRIREAVALVDGADQPLAAEHSRNRCCPCRRRGQGRSQAVRRLDNGNHGRRASCRQRSSLQGECPPKEIGPWRQRRVKSTSDRILCGSDTGTNCTSEDCTICPTAPCLLCRAVGARPVLGGNRYCPGSSDRGGQGARSCCKKVEAPRGVIPLHVLCPITKNPVLTKIADDVRWLCKAWHSNIEVSCPHCNMTHQIQGKRSVYGDCNLRRTHAR